MVSSSGLPYTPTHNYSSMMPSQLITIKWRQIRMGAPLDWFETLYHYHCVKVWGCDASICLDPRPSWFVYNLIRNVPIHSIISRLSISSPCFSSGHFTTQEHWCTKLQSYGGKPCSLNGGFFTYPRFSCPCRLEMVRVAIWTFPFLDLYQMRSKTAWSKCCIVSSSTTVHTLSLPAMSFWFTGQIYLSTCLHATLVCR